MSEFIIIETTYPNLEQAKNLAKILLSENFAACVHFQPIESMYIWKGKLENDAEILVRIKSKKSFFDEIEKIIKKHHGYMLPEIISINIDEVEEKYGQWLAQTALKKNSD